MKPLDLHHAAWLSARDDRSEDWLRARLADGFDVHHLDGDHDNNDPANLILIEHLDHMRLHGMEGRVARRLTAKGGGRPKGAVSNKGELAYAHRLRTGEEWAVIGAALGITKRTALVHARNYAFRTSKPWPLARYRP